MKGSIREADGLGAGNLGGRLGCSAAMRKNEEGGWVRYGRNMQIASVLPHSWTSTICAPSDQFGNPITPRAGCLPLLGLVAALSAYSRHTLLYWGINPSLSARFNKIRMHCVSRFQISDSSLCSMFKWSLEVLEHTLQIFVVAPQKCVTTKLFQEGTHV